MRNSYPLWRNGFQCFTQNFNETPLKKPKGIRGTRHLRFALVVGKADAPESADAASPRFAGPNEPSSCSTERVYARDHCRHEIRLKLIFCKMHYCLATLSSVESFKGTIIKRIMALTERVYTHFDVQQLIEAIDMI